MLTSSGWPAHHEVLPAVDPFQGSVVLVGSGPGRAGQQLADILVPRQLRGACRQCVPVLVTAFTEESIKARDAKSVADLDNFTPGPEINDTSVTQPSYTIRGVKTDDFGIGTEPSVGIFVDGSYAARTGSALIFVNDIRRVGLLQPPADPPVGPQTPAGPPSYNLVFAAEFDVDSDPHGAGFLQFPVTSGVATVAAVSSD